MQCFSFLKSQNTAGASDAQQISGRRLSDYGVAGTEDAAPQMSSQMPLLVCFLGEREGECWPLGAKAAFKPRGFGATVKWGYQGSLGKRFELQLLRSGEPIRQMRGQN